MAAILSITMETGGVTIKVQHIFYSDPLITMVIEKYTIYTNKKNRYLPGVFFGHYPVKM